MTLTLSLFNTSVWSQEMNKFVLSSVKEMPLEGGYELTETPARRMMEAFSLGGNSDLNLDPILAVPSYCTTATYMVFYKALEKYWASRTIFPSEELLKKLKPEMEKDGVRTWGRWNSNGPGTAKLFFDTGLGKNFDDLTKAIPGDFIKIFWNDQVGKLEKGHTGIFLGLTSVNGEKAMKFWASSKSTNGFSERTILMSEAERILFSRLTNPENVVEIAKLPEEDDFLASMLNRVSSWEELKRASGF